MTVFTWLPEETETSKTPVVLVTKVGLGVGNDTLMLPAVAVTVGLSPTTPASALTAALNVPVPPVARNVKVDPGTHLPDNVAGVTTSVAGGGAAVPNTLLAVGGVNNVRPAASVIANVRPVKHVPFVVIVKPPPLRCTGAPVMLIALGKLVPTV